MTIKSELDRLRLSYIAFRYDVVTGMFEGYDGTSWKHLDKVRYNAGNFEGWNGSAWVVIADTSEATARIAADCTLQANINIEITNRTVADSSLQAAILVETTARTVADSSLQASILTEATSRTVADSSLQANINIETTARLAADSSLQTELDTTQASIGDFIDSITGGVLGFSGTNYLDAEITITNAIEVLDSQLYSENTSRLIADSSLQSAILSEATSRAVADSSLQAAILVETTARTTADSLLQYNISVEDTLNPNPEETFIYYTRSDFRIDQFKFLGTTTGTQGVGVVTLDVGQNFISSNLLGPVFLADNPVVNTAQVRLLYNVGKVDASAVISLSTDGGSNWVAASSYTTSGLFYVGDFTFTAGTTSTDLRVKIVSGTAASELAGFGVNVVQDSTGSYAGDATKEIRVITSTEASTGLITLTQVRFTPGAGQLHCNYNGHDFITPDFIELGGGQVQFPLAFFTTGDTAKFYVGYGLVNTSNAPMTINNMLSSNSTLGSAVIPTGYTLDKPWMEIPAGAVITGAGNIETTGYITGAGILATTGAVVSTAKAPTQPKFDRIEEASLGKSVSFPNGIRLGNETLTIYDEGTWVPVITRAVPGTLAVTYAARSAKYTRIGNLVMFEIFLYHAITVGTSSGAWSVPLPFTIAGAGGIDNGAANLACYGADFTAGTVPFGLLTGGLAAVVYYQQARVDVWTIMAHPGTYSIISGHFFV